MFHYGGKLHKPKRYPRPHLRAIWFIPNGVTKLAKDAGVSPKLLESVVERSIDPYIDFQMKKRTGGYRTIAAPSKEFRPALDYLLGLLSNDFIHANAFAYVSGRSVADCARLHEGIVWGVKVDLKDFFQAIDEDMIYIALTRSGLASNRAKMLSKLATRVSASQSSIQTQKIKRLNFLGVRKGRGVYRRVGTLPQGSPLSGYLANLVAWDLDCRLHEIARDLGMNYSRYSDDILLSSQRNDFDRTTALTIVSEIRKAANEVGFDLNSKKTRILTPGARKQHLGLLIDRPGVRLTKEKRRSIEAMFWALEKFGVLNHVQRNIAPVAAESSAQAFELAHTFINRLWGQIAYVLDVEPQFAKKLLERIVELSERDEFLKHPDGGANLVSNCRRILAQTNRW